MKRRLLLLLTAIMAMLPATLSAREFTYEYAGETIKYNVLDEKAKTCEVAAWNQDVIGNLLLPAHPSDGETEYTLVAIGDRAFSGNYNLTEVAEIPETVKTIGDYAFFMCHWLERIELPRYLESIGRFAFASCNERLYWISIPKSVKFIGADAFMTCNNLNAAQFASIEALCNIELRVPMPIPSAAACIPTSLLMMRGCMMWLYLKV